MCGGSTAAEGRGSRAAGAHKGVTDGGRHGDGMCSITVYSKRSDGARVGRWKFDAGGGEEMGLIG